MTYLYMIFSYTVPFCELLALMGCLASLYATGWAHCADELSCFIFNNHSKCI